MRESISIVRRLCAEANVVGFDLVELHPALDLTYQTTLNYIIKACITGLAMREEGLDASHPSPVSSEHAIDDYYGDQQFFLDATEIENLRAKQKREGERE